MDAIQLRIEEAAGDVADLNERIIKLAKTLIDRDREYADPVPTAYDVTYVLEEMAKMRLRRDQLEGRLMQSIRDGFTNERKSRFVGQE
jgi:hypothetical protein